MDLTNISILFIPLGLTTIQSGIPQNEAHSNFITKFSNGSLYSLLGIILSYMKIMSFENVTIKFLDTYEMSGFDLATCFFVLIAIVLMINHIIIDQVKNSFWRCFWSMIALIGVIIPSFLIVFYEQFLI